MPLSESHCFICCTLLGFSKEVIRFMAVVSSCRERVSMSIAARTSSISNRTPRSLIS